MQTGAVEGSDEEFGYRGKRSEKQQGSAKMHLFSWIYMTGFVNAIKRIDEKREVIDDSDREIFACRALLMLRQQVGVRVDGRPDTSSFPLSRIGIVYLGDQKYES